MTVHITIPVDDEVLERARQEAQRQGTSIEVLVTGLLASRFGKGNHTPTGRIEDLFDLFEGGEPTDIARDKDKMIGEAVWQEHLRKTRQSS